jgi:1-deoxy-D-xylulose-5-phosphate reductoisomerase
MRRICILGSTGSIGTQTLHVIRQHPDKFKVVGLAAHSNSELLKQQAAEFGVGQTSLFVSEGIAGLNRIATLEEADTVVVSVAGVIGLLPTFNAIQAGKNIALASKEVLVAAGELVMPLIQKYGVTMTPIDSEHSAMFQCLQGYRSDQVLELILTASGGPFKGRTRAEIGEVSTEMALKHPTWSMGGKITIDSATLMNKALEIIEAKWLFGVPLDNINVVIHPQSVVHSLVKFTDGSVLGQMGWPSMRIPILYALSYPERLTNDVERWSPELTPNLTFETVDHDTFPAIKMARQVELHGGTMPASFNAANEEAVALFLQGKSRFWKIYDAVQHVIQSHQPLPVSLETIQTADSEARSLVQTYLLK